MPNPARPALAALAALLLASSAAFAQATAAATSPSLRVAQFGWLAGEWHGTLSNGMHAQMHCSRPEQGSMVCWFRLTSDEATVMYELISLLDTPAGAEMRFRHFSPQLQAWSDGPPTTMPLDAASTVDTLRFENPRDGQPKRSILTRTGPNSYVSHSDLVAADGGTSVIEVAYTRAP